MKSGCVRLFASLLLLVIGGDALPITLTVSPSDILSGRNFCPNTSVSFTCTAYNVRALRWVRNGSEIALFTSLDTPSPEPRPRGAFTLYLNTSDNDGQNNLNMTSTLVGVASDFQIGDQIACLDVTGDTQVLNFMLITNTPAPDDYNAFINKSASDSVYFSIQWDSAFSNMHRIETYTLEVSDGFIECPLTCLPSDEGPCQCSGLTTGSDGNITITATSCGNLQGPPTVIYVKPRVPPEVPICSSYPVYGASNMLTMLGTTWNKTMDPSKLALGVSQNITGYSVSVNRDNAIIECSNISSNCSYSYTIPSPSSSFTVSVAAVNVFGDGPVGNCNLSSISQTNDVFSIVLSTTNSNRSVECIRQSQRSGKFSCRFCITLTDNSTICYGLEDNSAANVALTNLPNGTYFYRVIAFINGVPMASVYDFFSTYCQPSELGASDEQVNSNCLTIPNGMVCYDGTIADSVATYVCDDAYTLIGTTQRMCRSDGRWKGSIPSCNATVPSWVIPLFSISVVLYVLCIAEIIISKGIAVYLYKVSQIQKRFLIKVFVTLIVGIVLLILIFCLWMVYVSDRIGVHGRNSVIAAFVFSLLLLAWSVIDASIVAFVFIKSKVYDVEKSSEAKSSNDVSKEEMSSVAKSDDDVGREEMSSAARSDDSDDDQPHKSIEQPARFGLPQ